MAGAQSIRPNRDSYVPVPGRARRRFADLRGEAGPRQIDGAEVPQWTTPWGDSLILTR